MALIKCKECGSEVSSKAETCPKCGARVAAKPMGCGSMIGLSIIGLILFSLISSNSTSTSGSRSSASSNSSSQASTVIARSIPVADPIPVPVNPDWDYYQSDDSMGKGRIYQAEINSVNTVNFDFPYSGAQHGSLTLRTHPRYGKDVIFSIEKGQILCRSYEECTVLVRFDEEKAMTFSGIGPSDNSTEHVFIKNYSRFLEKMLKAKTVRISANIYQQGAPIFEFDVSNFRQESYKPRK